MTKAGSFMSILRRSFLFLTLALAGTQAPAATYYAAKTGNDANPGTQSQPWLTVQKAANTMAAGDTVNVASGNYNEVVTISKSGSAGSPITFHAVSLGTIINGGFVLNGNYAVLDGFSKIGAARAFHIPGSNNIVQNCNVTGTNLDQVMVIKGNNNLIVKNVFHDMNDVDIMNMWGQYNVIRGNEVYNIQNPNVNLIHSDFCQTFGSGSASVNYNANFNVLEDNFVHDSGIQVGNITFDNDPSMHDYTFRNNIFLNVGGSLFVGLPNTHLYNNTWIHSGYFQGYPVLFYQQNLYSSVGSEVVNNAFIASGPVGSSSANLASLLIDHNYFATLAWSGVSLSGGGSLGTHAINGGDSKLVSVSGNNFHLTSSSPLNDAGVTLAGFNADKDGLPRPQGTAWSIGAYEFPVGANAPPAPQDFRKM
jgi:hypothetical protein